MAQRKWMVALMVFGCCWAACLPGWGSSGRPCEHFHPAPASASTDTARVADNSPECYWCSGTGKCAQDARPGSGLDASGHTDLFCGGSGVCAHCNGSKKLSFGRRFEAEVVHVEVKVVALASRAQLDHRGNLGVSTCPRHDVNDNR